MLRANGCGGISTLVRNAFPDDFIEVNNKSKEWADLVIEREFIYHVFIDHFKSTCFIAEDRGEMIGYLLGYRSQTHPELAVIHLIQVAPRLRGNGVGRRMFNQFRAVVEDMGCTKVNAFGRPENKYCAGFYTALGFQILATEHTIEVNGIQAIKDYNGPGKHVVVWQKEL
jgi:ribosomal protein S18 acetylase RimI-like enzyme